MFILYLFIRPSITIPNKTKKGKSCLFEQLEKLLKIDVFSFFTKFVASSSSRNVTIFIVELHFGKNKDMRKIGQIDIKKAKSIYLEEVAASGLLSKEELNRLWVVYSFDD